MSVSLVLLSAFVLFSSNFSVHVSASTKKHQQSFITEVVKANPSANRVGETKCAFCDEFATQALDALLQFVLQVGVVDTCGDLCQAFGQKTSPAIGAVCTILCDVVGVKEFVNIISKEDLDPIYYCELLTACPINDNGDAKISTFEVDPKKGPQGQFSIAFEYHSQNGTGTGQIVLDIDTVDGIPLGQGFLNEAAPAGTYDGTFTLKAEPNPDCDPTQGPCEQWLPGSYTVKLALCNGECGSKHPHSAIYDEATTTFTISGDKN